MTQQAWIAAGQGLLTSSQNWLNQQIATRQAEADREFRQQQIEDERKWREDMLKAELDREEEARQGEIELKATVLDTMYTPGHPNYAGGPGFIGGAPGGGPSGAAALGGGALRQDLSPEMQASVDRGLALPPEEQVAYFEMLAPMLETDAITMKAERRDAEMMQYISPLMLPEFQGATLSEALVLRELGRDIFTLDAQEVFDADLDRTGQMNEFTMSTILNRGESTETYQYIADRFSRLTGEEWTPDMVRGSWQMMKPVSRGVGVGGAGVGVGGDAWAVFNEFDQGIQRQIQQLAIQGNTTIPDIITGGISQGVIIFDEFGIPRIDPQGWEMYAARREIEIPISAEPTQAPQAEVAFYVGLLETMDLQAIITDITNRSDLTEPQKANLISAIRKEAGVGEPREGAGGIMLGI